ncbi:MAG: DUF2892 domain-containing protein [Pseudomonadota bacterium]|uniref:DUF2892 domain-containing protein n=1 Tax=Alteromonas alba TaxID=2079529 RepID=A0A2S9V618_9ALTE|nr:DUF2892 domain-containing protein [Alteromonas alba]MAJ69107.1 hypothetical protein [Alteromonadaceae bacterium]MCP4866393.1 DUF2892 domain-containing protein [Alteromonas sp.]MDY6927221.1 DUF2892 domain-containing protein [Pseudomonadota bacterium]RPH14199.1 MAG: DUF2892 domain-containing protein [Alteromonadaceae bacterium TMED7]PRO71891.1 DUF2892 domain-containing protein [Alteromonas alba]|tara:strand:- start:311 stop:496 length:186 start_codon:yes stop_codon:yes gene_type:complete
MNANVGGIDKVLRVVFGLLIISAGVYYQSWWGAVGAIILLTGIINFCPLYLPFGISSCKKD